MSRLEELIAELCPNGVEYRQLSEILTIRNGKDYKEFSSGSIPVYGSGGIIAYIDTFVYDKPSVLLPRKGSIDKIYYVDTPFWTVDTIFYTIINRSSVLEKYVYYAIQVQHIEKLNTGGGVPSLTQSILNKVKIPIPPLPIQEEIVRILDNFAKLTAELTEELTAELNKRKQQYQYYRDYLLTFDKKGAHLSDRQTEVNSILWNKYNYDVNYIKLSELFEFKNGLNKGKEFFGRGDYIVKYMDVYKHSSLTKENLTDRVEVTNNEKEKLSARKGDVFFTRTSETREEIGFASVLLEDVEGCVFSGFLIRARQKTKKLLPKYCAYCFKSKGVREQIIKNCIFTTRASLSGSNLGLVKIPVPPLAEQTRIVSILDRFDALCNDLTSGLPAEIEARKKQYEYYRDKLLTFREAV